MGREIVRAQQAMLMLGSMRADERLAVFLLDFVERLHAHGFSRTEVILQMTRTDIGSYLGLKLETVSRIFARLIEKDLLEVNQRHIHILDPVALIQSISQPQGRRADRCLLVSSSAR
jgi:CRP/FNR family transcriptional regulator